MQYPFRKEEGRNQPWWSPNSHTPHVLLEKRRRGSLMKAWVTWATFLLPLASVLSEDHPCPFLSWPHLRKAWGRSPCSSPFVGRLHAWWGKLSQVLDGDAGGFSSKTILYLLRRLDISLLLLLFSHSVLSNSLWPMDYSMPGFPVFHHLPEFAQTHVYWVCAAIQPSHPLSSPSPPAFNLFQH